MDKFCTLSATQLADLIKKGQASSEQVVAAHIEQIQKVNPHLNALVRNRFDAAMDEARQADRLLSEKGPQACPLFHGVPCTIKESFALVGMPNTSGLAARKKIVATEDATAVARLRRAGAIPMGVTNLPELAMWMETDNRIYGRTNNPYDVKRIAGGSSGGEGAIIGAGGSPFGLGSDIGGSIRMPAFFNGIFGHKPTAGLVPNTGQFPHAENEISGYATTGPMCRRAADLWPLVRTLAGPDGKDHGCVSILLKDPDTVDLAGLRVVVIPGTGNIRVHPELAAAQKKAAQILEKAGAKITTARLPLLKKSFLIWASMLSAVDSTPFGTTLGNGKPVRLAAETAKWAIGASAHTLPALLLAAMERLPADKSAAKYVALGKELRKDLLALLGDDGIILYPPYSRLAPRHHLPLLYFHHFVHTGIFNVMGFPATECPMGISPKGLPLGVQAVAAPGNDHLSVAAALALEKANGGWIPPALAG
ncbi:MAG: amidase [Thermodesulfobacteriota bacterium]